MIIHGWTVYAHPLFAEQLNALTEEVERLKANNPQTYQQKNATKRLAAITRLAFDIIPQDPSLPEYRQGSTLGKTHKHWYRAKFFQQYRLFFRYHLQSKIIVLAWINDEATKRAYDSKTDAYRVFQKMLASGNPPDDWQVLLKESQPINQKNKNN